MKTISLVCGIILVTGLITISCKQKGKGQNQSVESTDSRIPEVTINTNESKVYWAGTSLGVYTHTGTLNFNEAALSVEDGKITGGKFTVDLTSMVTTDTNFNEAAGYTRAKLLGHLASPDFFDVENYPTAGFVITGVEGNNVTGNLTIRGITHEEKVENVTTFEENGKVKITGDLIFDRKKYNVSWDYNVKDMLLKKEIELKIELVGV